MADNGFRSEGAELVRRNRAWLALGASPYLLGLALFVAAATTGHWLLALSIPHMTVFGTLGLWWAYSSNRNPVHLPGGITVDDEAVYHAGRLVARRDDLEAGLLSPKRGEFTVRLQRRGPRPSIVVKVRDAEEGRALLRALGFDAQQTAVELRAASSLFTWGVAKQLLVTVAPILVALLLLGMLIGSRSPRVAAFGIPAVGLSAFVWMFGLIFSPTRVRIGVDGIVTRWLGKERFIPLSRVTGVGAYEERVGGKTYVGVAVQLAGGERVKIPAGQKGWMQVDPNEIEERIREAQKLHQDGADAVDARALERGGRDTRAWVAALRALGAGANADMRTAPVPAEKLLRIAEDASAPAVVRAGAAVAAGASPDARQRLRVAAKTTASPSLRVALERVAADDATDEALAEALGELDEIQARAR
jgi:hypothetical protein